MTLNSSRLFFIMLDDASITILKVHCLVNCACYTWNSVGNL